MKILIVTEWYEPVRNGVVTSVRNLMEELRKEDHEVRVVTMSHDLQTVAEQDVYYIGSLNANIVYPEARATLYFPSWVVDELREWHPDVIHTQSEFSGFLLAQKLSGDLGIPIVHTYHTVYEDYTHYLIPSKRLGRVVVRIFTRDIINRVDAVIAPTEKTRQILRSYGINSLIEVIPTGLDLSRFTGPVTGDWRQALRRKYRLPSEAPLMLFLGRLAKEKNLEAVLDSMLQCREKGYHLVVAGPGPHREELMEYARQKGLLAHVHFLGAIPYEEVPDVYGICDVFVTASQSETQGLTYIEAMASGLPVICIKDSSVDGVVVNGETGWQCEGVEEICNKVQQVLQDKDSWQRYSRAAKQLAHTGYSREVFAQRVLALYRKAIADYHYTRRSWVNLPIQYEHRIMRGE